MPASWILGLGVYKVMQENPYVTMMEIIISNTPDIDLFFPLKRNGTVMHLFSP